MITVYHGSHNRFDKFDYDKIRTNGTSEGVGFYFTDNREIAERYAGNSGYLYTVELHTNKSLSNNNKTITKGELSRLIESIPREIDFLSNYGDVDYEGYDSVLAEAVNSEYNYSETDTEILGSLYNTCGGNGYVVELFYSVLGYDSIVTRADWGQQNLYIALVNDVIEIVDVFGQGTLDD